VGTIESKTDLKSYERCSDIVDPGLTVSEMILIYVVILVEILVEKWSHGVNIFCRPDGVCRKK
jgi:hypothetical protein